MYVPDPYSLIRFHGDLGRTLMRLDGLLDSLRRLHSGQGPDERELDAARQIDGWTATVLPIPALAGRTVARVAGKVRRGSSASADAPLMCEPIWACDERAGWVLLDGGWFRLGRPAASRYR